MSEERFEQSGTKERNLGMELVRVTEAAALSAVCEHLTKAFKEILWELRLSFPVGT